VCVFHAPLQSLIFLSFDKDVRHVELGEYPRFLSTSSIAFLIVHWFDKVADSPSSGFRIFLQILLQLQIVANICRNCDARF
jgi:hypothetical protein